MLAMTDAVLGGLLGILLILPLGLVFVAYLVEERNPGDVWITSLLVLLWVLSVGLLVGFGIEGDNRFNDGEANYIWFWIAAAVVYLGSGAWFLHIKGVEF